MLHATTATSTIFPPNRHPTKNVRHPKSKPYEFDFVFRVHLQSRICGYILRCADNILHVLNPGLLSTKHVFVCVCSLAATLAQGQQRRDHNNNSWQMSHTQRQRRRRRRCVVSLCVVCHIRRLAHTHSVLCEAHACGLGFYATLSIQTQRRTERAQCLNAKACTFFRDKNYINLVRTTASAILCLCVCLCVLCVCI